MYAVFLLWNVSSRFAYCIKAGISLGSNSEVFFLFFFFFSVSIQMEKDVTQKLP